MKYAMTAILLFGLWAFVSTLESFDHINRYHACLEKKIEYASTDIEVDQVIGVCETLSGYKSPHRP